MASPLGQPLSGPLDSGRRPSWRLCLLGPLTHVVIVCSLLLALLTAARSSSACGKGKWHPLKTEKPQRKPGPCAVGGGPEAYPSLTDGFLPGGVLSPSVMCSEIPFFMAALGLRFCEGLVQLQRAGPSFGVQASHCGGFLSFRARALSTQASLAAISFDIPPNTKRTYHRPRVTPSTADALQGAGRGADRGEKRNSSRWEGSSLISAQVAPLVTSIANGSSQMQDLKPRTPSLGSWFR
ncbi:hypothetical protein MJG53_006607 [Ovis ammon polii x Ovis aries]|uniref:Uncharacterized protein n=1 Tax=Ovis ammon polii x Ovis aries TaxID=2918886 RepID=A0ACB9V5P8_9CETA|nr:hypothetical protein MJG53_006607 [Ovis ammon polii x Ovis aries]